jgi:hypothetical protein
MTRYGFVLALLLVPACANVSATDGNSTVEADSVKPASDGWYVIRQDQRKCVAPGCGGYFVKRVNLAKTICLDNVSRTECYVAGIDWAATTFSSDEQQKIASSPVVFHGRLIDGHYATGKYANLSVATVWSPAGTPTVSNGYLSVDYDMYLAFANGVRCIAAPCKSTTQQKLNTSESRNVAGVDLSSTTANDKQIVEGTDAVETTTGILVDGFDGWTSGAAGSARQLVAANFFLQVQPAPTEIACGGFVGTPCPGDNQYCDVTVANACNGADLPGVCKITTKLCSEIYSPVCGCDGQTYSNDCFRVGARVQLDHTGACAQ